MVIRLADGTSTAIDYREMAPGAASRDMYLDAAGTPTMDSRIGPRAAGIPGVVRGLELAHEKFGKLPWRELVEPAVKLARDGVVLDSFHAGEMAAVTRTMADFAGRGARGQAGASGRHGGDVAARFASRTGRRIAAGRDVAAAGSRGHARRQSPPAAPMRSIAARWRGRWRRGSRRWAASGPKPISAAYKAVEREPIRFTYHGHDVLTMPPPSGGGITMRQILAASDALHLERLDWDSVDRIHLYVEGRCGAFLPTARSCSAIPGSSRSR